MKITIEKVYNPITDERYFWLQVEGSSFGKCFSFKENAPDDDIYSEKANYEKALALAERIEKHGTTESSKIVVFEKETNQ